VNTVTPVHGRPLAYLVSSRKTPGKQYLCDLTDHDGNGSCVCQDWSCRCVANLKRPHDLLTDATLCHHLRLAHLHNLSVQLDLILEGKGEPR